MKLSKTDIEAMAKKSRFCLTEAEKDSLADFLNEILICFDKLNTIDTKDTEPIVSMGNKGSVMRYDKVLPSLQQDDTLSNAAKTEDGFFCVPYLLGAENKVEDR